MGSAASLHHHGSIGSGALRNSEGNPILTRSKTRVDRESVGKTAGRSIMGAASGKKQSIKRQSSISPY